MDYIPEILHVSVAVDHVANNFECDIFKRWLTMINVGTSPFQNPLMPDSW